MCRHPNCSFRALNQRGLETHVANHMTKPAIICDFPNYEAPIQARLIMHMKKHDHTRPFSCTFQDSTDEAQGTR